MNYGSLNRGAVSFLEKMRGSREFEYSFSPGNKPSLIGSSLAVMLSSFLGELKCLSFERKKAWAESLNSCQLDSGFFSDDDIADQNLVPGYLPERALFHRTRHALFALGSLGYSPKKPFRFIDEFMDQKKLRQWLENQNYKNFWDVSNKIMDLGLFLTHEVNSGNFGAKEGIQVILDFCDENTDSKTGYQDGGKSELRNAMAGAMHIYPLYFYWKRRPKYIPQVVDSTISLQNSDGFFSYDVGSCGEDCLDYDAVNILTNFYFLTDDPIIKMKIKLCFQKLLDVIPQCINSDGGFCCHRRNEKYRFGTWTTEMEIGGSSLWATYSRLVTIAFATKILQNHPASGDWNLGGKNIMEIWDAGLGLKEVQ